MQIQLSNGLLHFYQWDTGQKVKAPDGVETIHFRIDNDHAAPVTVASGWATVPDECFQSGDDLVYYAYDVDHTTDSARVEVARRPKPADYIYTPTEIKTWEQLDERIKALENGGGVAGVSSVNGQTGAVTITAEGLGALTEDDLQEATDKALAQAKASGEFDGEQGPNGKDGVTPNIQIGTVTTLDAGSDATASMTGTAAEPLLNLGIPRGATGDSGSGNGMKLVADVTADDETNMISINKNSDGTALKIQRYAIRITIPAHERTSRGTFYVRCFSYGGGMILNNMLMTDGQEISFAIAQIMDTMQPPIITTSWCVRVGCISSRGANYFESIQGFPAEASIVQVYTNSTDVMFPAGTNVKVYGVSE